MIEELTQFVIGKSGVLVQMHCPRLETDSNYVRKGCQALGTSPTKAETSVGVSCPLLIHTTGKYSVLIHM